MNRSEEHDEHCEIKLPAFMATGRFQQILIALLFLIALFSSMGFISIQEIASGIYKFTQISLPLPTKACLYLFENPYPVIFPVLVGVLLLLHIFVRKRKALISIIQVQIFLIGLFALTSMFVLTCLFLPYVDVNMQLK